MAAPQRIVKRIENFRGWVPDIDQREIGDPTEESFQELIGFDPTRVIGVLSKDFGYTNNYVSVPHYPGSGTMQIDNGAPDNGIVVRGTGSLFITEFTIGAKLFASNTVRQVVSIQSNTELRIDAPFFSSIVVGTPVQIGISILGHQSFHVSDLNQEFEVCWGLGGANQLKIFIQQYYDGTYTNNWIELTESFLNLSVVAINIDGTDPSLVTVDISVNQTYATNYFKNWMIFIPQITGSPDGRFISVKSSIQISGSIHRLTPNEYYSNAFGAKMSPNADIGLSVWYSVPDSRIKGTGTISSTGTAVVGVGTLFTSETPVGSFIDPGNGDERSVTVVTDNTHLTVDNAWDYAGENVPAGTIFYYFQGLARYSKINEDPPNDSNYVLLSGTQTNSFFEVAMTNLSSTPLVNGKTRVTFRVLLASLRSATLLVELRKGASVIGSTYINAYSRYLTTNYNFEVNNSTIGTIVSDWDDIRLRFTGTLTSGGQILVTYASVAVDTATTYSNVNLYRFPVVKTETFNLANAGISPSFYPSRGHNKIEFGYKNTALTRLNPFEIIHIDRKYFALPDGSFDRSINQIYFERQDCAADAMSGITIIRSAGGQSLHRIVILPLLDGYQIGDPIYDDNGTSSIFAIYVEWAKLNKRITDLILFTEWKNANNKVSEHYDRVYQTAPIEYILGIDTKRPSVLSLTTGATTWTRTYDSKYYTTFQVDHFIADAQPLSLTLNQYRGASHTSGAVKWTKRIQMTKQQSSLVAVDESDDAIRLSFYDTLQQHEDDVFPNVAQDKNGTPLLIFLATEGKLMAMAELNGNLYAFKQSSVQVTNLVNFSSKIISVDCISERGVKSTVEGIVFLGTAGVYIFPRHGGLQEQMNFAFADTYRNTSFTYKQEAIVEEVRLLNSIIISMQTSTNTYTQFIYNTLFKQWWKRRWSVNPKWLSTREDGTLEFTDSKYIFQYPDRSTYYDRDSYANPVGQYWEIKSQWLAMGMDDAVKVLRTIVPIILGGNSFQVHYRLEIFFDRRTTAFDILYGNSMINTIQESALLLKTPNSFREVQFRITHDPRIAETDIDKFDITGIRMYGESFSSPIDR